MKRHQLSDGHWADIREADEVTVRGRRAIQAISLSIKDFLLESGATKDTKMSDLALTEEQADSLLRLQEAVVAAAVAGWSYDEPPPNMQTVGDMPSKRFDELSRLTANLGANLALDAEPTLEPSPKVPSGSYEPSAGS